MEIFDRLGNLVVDKLNTVSPDEVVEFYPIAVLYALDVMCGTYRVVKRLKNDQINKIPN